MNIFRKTVLGILFLVLMTAGTFAQDTDNGEVQDIQALIDVLIGRALVQERKARNVMHFELAGIQQASLADTSCEARELCCCMCLSVALFCLSFFFVLSWLSTRHRATHPNRQ